MLIKEKGAFCPKCGEKLKKGDKYCIACGYSLEKRKKKLNLLNITIAIIILIIIWIAIRLITKQPIIPSPLTDLIKNFTK